MIKVVIIGFGVMGKKTTEELALNQNIEILAVVDKKKELKNTYTNDYLESNLEIPIKNSIEDVEWENVDIAIIMSDSFISKIEPLLIKLANKRINILTIAEEMAYPEISNKDITNKVDSIAKKNNISILGTGINPGFIFDYLIIILSNVCLEVNEIVACRINDLSEFGDTVLNSQGIGLSENEFQKGVKDGKVVGHVGFKQSIHLISNAFNWELIDFKEQIEPILASKDICAGKFSFRKNTVIGCNHQAYATFKNNKKIVLEHPQQICVEDNPVTKDEIIFKGVPDIKLKIEPEIPGGIGTVAMIINMIPLILEAKPGLITLLDLPRTPAIFNKIRSNFN